LDLVAEIKRATPYLMPTGHPCLDALGNRIVGDFDKCASEHHTGPEARGEIGWVDQFHAGRIVRIAKPHQHRKMFERQLTRRLHPPHLVKISGGRWMT
jgi:hypothetical protein